MRKALNVSVGDRIYRLRLTLNGQRELKARFHEDTLQTLLSAAGDSERMGALLTQALCWEDSGNELCDGERLYEMLVDQGWAGQARFGALAFDIGAASGLLTEEQARALKETMSQAVEEAFQSLRETAKPDSQPEEEVPFPEREG